MISLKPGLVASGVRPETLLAIMVVDSILSRHNIPLVLTELTGAKHMEGSLHYKGLAVDLRSKVIPREILDNVVFEIKEALGSQYDVVLEAKDQDNEHMHVEFDPK
jgi:hypothetical protein